MMHGCRIATAVFSGAGAVLTRETLARRSDANRPASRVRVLSFWRGPRCVRSGFAIWCDAGCCDDCAAYRFTLAPDHGLRVFSVRCAENVLPMRVHRLTNQMKGVMASDGSMLKFLSAQAERVEEYVH